MIGAPPLSPARTTRGIDPLSSTGLPLFRTGFGVYFNGLNSFMTDRYAVEPIDRDMLQGLSSNLTLIIAFRPDMVGGGGMGLGGWIISSNDLFADPRDGGPTGFGLYLDEIGVLRPLVASENRYQSFRILTAGTQIVTLEASPNLYRMWLNSSLEFDKMDTSDPANPRTVGPRSSLHDPGLLNESLLARSSRTQPPLPPYLTLGVGATAGQQDEYFKGSIAEILLYNQILSESERRMAERALCLRWSDCSGVAGQINFMNTSADVSALIHYYNVPVYRASGSDGIIIVSYYIYNGTATPGREFYMAEGNLTWEHGDDSLKYVPVHILNPLMSRNRTSTVFVKLLRVGFTRDRKCLRWKSAKVMRLARFICEGAWHLFKEPK